MKKSNHQPISIAILPFQNISPTEELDHFVDGFTDDLITDLSRYSSLRVISKHSTQQIGNDDSHTEDLIPTLKADYLVKGSFREAGKNVRINAQLVQAEENVIIWSNRHDAKIENIFEILDDIIEQLVSTLQRQVDIDLLTASKGKPQTSLAAYEYWLLGMQELKNGNIDADNRARDLFQKALLIDPDYSRAYAGLSLSYFNEWSCQLWERWDYSQKGAFEYALKAVELDESNYVSMTVLGRLYIYKGDWEQAEHYLRKSLRLNPSDTDNLIQIASCFIYLGYMKEAEKLYLRAIKLNPFNTNWYFSFASMLYFEKGDFEKSILLGRKTDFQKVMVDMTAFIAGAYFHLGDYENMMVYWKKYLKVFQQKILRGNTLNEEEALKWVININPNKGKSNLFPFADHMMDRLGFNLPVHEKTQKTSLFHENQFTQKNKIWELVFNGEKVVLPDAKGFHDLAKLILSAGNEIHCLELIGGATLSGKEELVMDDKAKSDYRNKLAQLKEDIDEAQDMNDSIRAGHLQIEYDKLVDFLSKSMGLGGKQRKVTNEADKARSAVTWRIRSAIKKIKETHNSLGDHLENSIKTGTFCSYVPQSNLHWIF